MMKRSRRIVAVALLIIVLLTLVAGCGKKKKEEAPQQETQVEAEKEDEKAEAETEESEEAEVPESTEASENAESPVEESGSAESPVEESESAEATEDAESADEPEEPAIDKDGSYFSKEEVALYIHTYGELPSNYITKKEAQKLGWNGGSVEKYAPGKAIGGDYFGNYEGLLPKKKGRTYYECDIDTDGYHSRGSRRIIFSDDGLIYYTHDHYESFELLYGEED